jgi:hypothetical protein
MCRALVSQLHMHGLVLLLVLLLPAAAAVTE